MIQRCAILLIPLMALAGCAPQIDMVSAVPAGPDPVAVRSATQSAAQQVKRCYVAPRLGSEARQIVTVLRVRYMIEGSLLAPPELLRQQGVTETNIGAAKRMADAAIEAVVRCSPLRLPQELHAQGWDEFELTFSPRGLA